MKITLPIYYTIEKKKKKNQTILVWFNWYRNAHFLISNKIKHHYSDIISKMNLPPLKTPINIVYTVYIKRKDTDYWNIRSVMEKFVLDWLVVNWIIPDDSFDYVKWDTTQVFLDKENPRITIEFIELNK